MATHVLKTWPVYFEAIKRGEKTFEARRNDRGFQKGDTLVLKLFDPEVAEVLQHHTETMTFTVGWVLAGGSFGVEPGYAILSLLPAESRPPLSTTGGGSDNG